MLILTNKFFFRKEPIDFFFNDPIPETIDDSYSERSMYWMHEVDTIIVN